MTEGSVSQIKAKVKVVFLGDQSTGKTSLITRFINNRFEPDIGVLMLPPSPQSASTSSLKTSALITTWSGCSCGIQPDSNASDPSFPTTSRTPWWLCSCSICQV